MSPEKQNIEVSKLLGWTAPPGWNGAWPHRLNLVKISGQSVPYGVPPGEKYKSFNSGHQDNLKQIPDFFTDAQALSKAKQLLLSWELDGSIPNAVDVYTGHLCGIVGSELKYTSILATPEDEIKALLKTANKWSYDSP